jgi:UDP-N-acetylmuramoylalanine--D-glutamate ligase
MSEMPVSGSEDRSFAGRRVTVMGLGQFGGGLGVVQWLLQRGARVCVTDMASEATLAGPLSTLADSIRSGAVTLRLGGHATEDFTECDLVVANAAVLKPWEHPLLLAARQRGVPVTSEIRLAAERLDRARTVGITGSVGKSTTSSMIACALRALGRRVVLGGNIGGSLLGSTEPRDWTVLELSSAQLWWLSTDSGQAGWSPRVAVLTNLAPNHVDWHGSLGHYLASKCGIRSFQRDGDVFMSAFDADHPSQAAEMARACPMGAWWRGGRSVEHAPPMQLSIPGEHQVRNARLAWSTAAACAEIDEQPWNGARAAAGLEAFTGLEHRLQLVGTYHGMQCFNDSKATTPEATATALRAFPDWSRVHLIAGGYDKKVDLSSVRELAPRLAGLYAIGATAHQLAPAPPAIRCDTLAAAVDVAFSRGKPGDILLLSPACASYGEFTNFEERGRKFVELVRSPRFPARC